MDTPSYLYPQNTTTTPCMFSGFCSASHAHTGHIAKPKEHALLWKCSKASSVQCAFSFHLNLSLYVTIYLNSLLVWLLREDTILLLVPSFWAWGWWSVEELQWGWRLNQNSSWGTHTRTVATRALECGPNFAGPRRAREASHCTSPFPVFVHLLTA